MYHPMSAKALPRRRVIDARYEPVVITTLALPVRHATRPAIRPPRPLWGVVAAVGVALVLLFAAAFVAGWSR